jgi:hypothetical protein
MKFVVIGGTGLIGSKLVTRTPAIATESPMLAAAREVTASVYQAGSSTASTRQGVRVPTPWRAGLGDQGHVGGPGPGRCALRLPKSIHARQAACWYSWRMPPRCWVSSYVQTRAIWSGSVIGRGSGQSGRAFAMP